jgi:para-aminobenzoate synthetase component 1
MIRYIELLDGKMVFKSGGGITSLSNCGSEYNELIDKIYVPIGRKS